ncbi:MAG: carbonic anhydrase, partial [Bacteroidota bacterium]|nr:carbonic anhydrase [Bacteroidota bacterium]
GLGDVFSVRIAGNIINEDILGSLEYACKVAGSKLILVLGHSKCGATIGACSGVKIGNLTQLLNKFQPSIDTVKLQYPDAVMTDPGFVDAVSHRNVLNSINEIMTKSQHLKEMVDNGEIGIVGAFYNLDTGEVEFMDEHIKQG